MKGLDPSIQLVACGSSAYHMPTYMEWDRKVLETCWDQVDFISAHRYTGNHKGTAWYLGESLDVERTRGGRSRFHEAAAVVVDAVGDAPLSNRWTARGTLALQGAMMRKAGSTGQRAG